jgi:hypothetical protein
MEMSRICDEDLSRGSCQEKNSIAIHECYEGHSINGVLLWLLRSLEEAGPKWIIGWGICARQQDTATYSNMPASLDFTPRSSLHYTIGLAR